MAIDISRLQEDRDVVEPFVERLMLRLRERYPDVTEADVTVSIEVTLPPDRASDQRAYLRILRILREMADEGVVI